jgi:hypothetical protein
MMQAVSLITGDGNCDGAASGPRVGLFVLAGGLADPVVISGCSDLGGSDLGVMHEQPIAVMLDLISWTQPGPEDGLAASVGMQGSTKPTGRNRRGIMTAT